MDMSNYLSLEQPLGLTILTTSAPDSSRTINRQALLFYMPASASLPVPSEPSQYTSPQTPKPTSSPNAESLHCPFPLSGAQTCPALQMPNYPVLTLSTKGEHPVPGCQIHSLYPVLRPRVFLSPSMAANWKLRNVQRVNVIPHLDHVIGQIFNLFQNITG